MSVQDHTKIVLTGNFFVVFVRRAAYPAAFGHIDVVARRYVLAARSSGHRGARSTMRLRLRMSKTKKGLMISHKPLIYNVFLVGSASFELAHDVTPAQRSHY